MAMHIKQQSAPGYRTLLHTGELHHRATLLMQRLSHCTLCPWHCGIDRTSGERGRCRAPGEAVVAKAVAHYGEEPPVSGVCGSGTIFFSHCNLSCCFCQNFQISQKGLGRAVSAEGLAEMMLDLQQRGCHNINLVSAAHFLPFIIMALSSAAGAGLRLPLVYNTNGYEDTDVLRLLDGIIDIYLPDVKYACDEMAAHYCSAHNYSAVALQAVQEMVRQVGFLQTDDRGIAVRGVLVRHLVLPAGVAGTGRVLRGLKKNFGKYIPISLLGQYTPCFMARDDGRLGQKLCPRDYHRACKTLEALGFETCWIQDMDLLDSSFVPDFAKRETWN